MALPDSFTGVDGTDLTAYDALWVKHTSETGLFEINGNTAHKLNPPATTALYFYNSSPASADYYVSSSIKYASINAGVVGRVSSSANTGYMLRYGSGGVLQLYSFVVGSFTLVGSYSIGAVDNNFHTLKISMAGTTIKGFYDGVERISVTNSAVSATGFGGFRLNSGAEYCLVDDFDVVVAGGGGPTYTLTASGVGANFIGQSAALKAARLLSASASAMDFSGQSAALKASRKITASAAVIPFVGQSASLSALRTLSASVATMPFIGQAVLLKAARKLVTSAESMDFVGQLVTLTWSGSTGPAYTLTVSAASLDFVGQAANLKAARVLSAGLDSFDFVGQSIWMMYNGTSTQETAGSFASGRPSRLQKSSRTSRMQTTGRLSRLQTSGRPAR